jgi:Lrp/AsnC ligand binding domain
MCGVKKIKYSQFSFPYIVVMYKVIMSKAFILLNCDVGAEKNVIKEMKNISGVSQAAGLSGIYDIVAELNTDSENGIAKIVKKFRSIANIRSCMTMVVAEKHDATMSGKTGK